MAYDERTAQRVRQALQGTPEVTERKMFGGIAFLYQGNMCCGVNRRDLMLRLGNEQTAQALSEPHTREMDFTGKPIRSMLYVGSEGIRSQSDLQSWIERALAFASTLPAK